MLDTKFELTMEEIVRAISEAGYDPYDQLYGYVTKGKDEYITRNGNAREKIKQLKWREVKEYVENWKDAKDDTRGMGEASTGRKEISAVSKSKENT